MAEHLLEEWIPDAKTAALLNLVGLVATVAAIVGFAALYSAVNPGIHSFEISWRGLILLLVMLLVILVLMVVHEMIHGFALRTLGHKPTFGATMIGGATPAFYCTSLVHVSARPVLAMWLCCQASCWLSYRYSTSSQIYRFLVG